MSRPLLLSDKPFGNPLVRGEKGKIVFDRHTTLIENGVRGNGPCQTANKGRRPMSDRQSYVTPLFFVRRTFVVFPLVRSGIEKIVYNRQAIIFDKWDRGDGPCQTAGRTSSLSRLTRRGSLCQTAGRMSRPLLLLDKPFGHPLVRGEKKKIVYDRQTTLFENGVSEGGLCQTACRMSRSLLL